MGLSWHKKLSALFCEITSKHDGDFYCLNCLYSFRTENKLKEHENVCKNHDYCYIEMPKEEIISKCNYGKKSMKIPFIIYADIQPLLEKIDTCYNNPKNSSTTKINKHTAYSLFDHSLFMYCSFDATKNEHNYYIGKDCMKNFWKKACSKNKLSKKKWYH